ncbi:MAG: hypothetical protein KDE57_16165, partial [Calditrichaeota bacterium]|nr:hypothetical protein [Calditrichota bacterium]
MISKFVGSLRDTAQKRKRDKKFSGQNKKSLQEDADGEGILKADNAILDSHLWINTGFPPSVFRRPVRHVCVPIFL